MIFSFKFVHIFFYIKREEDKSFITLTPNSVVQTEKRSRNYLGLGFNKLTVLIDASVRNSLCK